MGAFSNYLEEKIVEHFLRNNAITPPTTVYVALFESDPGEATAGTETAYTGYARQAATWTALDANGQTKNVGALTAAATSAAPSSSLPHSGSGAISAEMPPQAQIAAKTKGIAERLIARMRSQSERSIAV